MSFCLKISFKLEKNEMFYIYKKNFTCTENEVAEKR